MNIKIPNRKLAAKIACIKPDEVSQKMSAVTSPPFKTHSNYA